MQSFLGQVLFGPKLEQCMEALNEKRDGKGEQKRRIACTKIRVPLIKKGVKISKIIDKECKAWGNQDFMDLYEINEYVYKIKKYALLGSGYSFK